MVSFGCKSAGLDRFGQSRRFDCLPTSGLTQSTDIIRPAKLVRFVPHSVKLLRCRAMSEVGGKADLPVERPDFSL